MDIRCQGFNMRLDKVKDFAKKGVTVLRSHCQDLQDAIEDLELDSRGAGPRRVSSQFNPNTTGLGFDPKPMEDRMDDLNHKINALISTEDKTAIKFAGLGWRNYREVVRSGPLGHMG
jgi:hypothetical protein